MKSIVSKNKGYKGKIRGGGGGGVDVCAKQSGRREVEYVRNGKKKDILTVRQIDKKA